jgi:hypothetical protein
VSVGLLGEWPLALVLRSRSFVLQNLPFCTTFWRRRSNLRCSATTAACKGLWDGLRPGSDRLSFAAELLEGLQDLMRLGSGVWKLIASFQSMCWGNGVSVSPLVSLIWLDRCNDHLLSRSTAVLLQTDELNLVSGVAVEYHAWVRRREGETSSRVQLHTFLLVGMPSSSQQIVWLRNISWHVSDIICLNLHAHDKHSTGHYDSVPDLTHVVGD